jgi:hypothetical protein
MAEKSSSSGGSAPSFIPTVQVIPIETVEVIIEDFRGRRIGVAVFLLMGNLVQVSIPSV